MPQKREPPLRVLIVEDEALLAMDLEGLVKDAGHRVVGEAASLNELGKLPDTVLPELALIDLQLAENTNGLEVARQVAQRWPDARIVFVTANPLKIPPDFCGADGLVSKPFSSNGMLSALGYLSEAICDPPPRSPRPESFTASPTFGADWDQD